MSDPIFYIYPSAMQKFQSLLDYELVAEERWNKRDDEYILTPDEMYDKLERELLDTLNRAPHAPREAADKGTAFNEIIDCLIENRGSSREDCTIGSLTNEKGERVARAKINHFTFDFDLELCKQVAGSLKGSIPQYLAQADIETSKGTVRLYGYIDEWKGAKIIDLKTTSAYEWGKFRDGWQRWVYPYCVVESGDTEAIESFIYYVVVWAYQRKDDAVIRAKDIYLEEYTYNHEEARVKLRSFLEIFLDWIEHNRHRITDTKLFTGQNTK